MLIMPLMLTVVSVQAQNQKEMKGSNIKAQELVLTQEWFLPEKGVSQAY